MLDGGDQPPVQVPVAHRLRVRSDPRLASSPNVQGGSAVPLEAVAEARHVPDKGVDLPTLSFYLAEHSSVEWNYK